MSAETIAEVIRGYRFLYVAEEQLQAAVAEVLDKAGFAVEREVRLSSRDRIDVLASRVGVECKIAGDHRDVRRQVERYLASELVDGLVLVTSRVRHLRLPAVVNGKPVEVVTIVGAGL